MDKVKIAFDIAPTSPTCPFHIEELDIDQLFLEKCVYTHSFNNTQSEIEDTFHGIAGCNGTISFKFNTPVYLWLLENM